MDPDTSAVQSIIALQYNPDSLTRTLQIQAVQGAQDGTRVDALRLRGPAVETIKIEAELDAKRRELGVEDALREIPGINTAMMVRFGENGVKTVEDLAGCATDDLAGWTERKDGENVREAGILDGFDFSREEAETLVMQARLKAGWVTEADLAPPPAAEEVAMPEVQA